MLTKKNLHDLAVAAKNECDELARLFAGGLADLQPVAAARVAVKLAKVEADLAKVRLSVAPNWRPAPPTP